MISNRYNITSNRATYCGNFGCIYPAMDLMEHIGSKKNGYKYKMYAVKLQNKTYTKSARSLHLLPLRKEFIMYKALSGGVGIPRTYAYSENSQKELFLKSSRCHKKIEKGVFLYLLV